MNVALGLDVGTSGVKAVAVDRDGRIVAEADRPHELLTPRPGWTEQRPADWEAGALGALQEVARRLREEGLEPLAIGLSGQMHGLVPLDARGEVLRPAILWNDQRTGAAVDEIHETVGRAELIRRTGNPAITGFQLPKLVWMRREEPELFARVRHALLPKDWLGWRLSGRMYAEPTDASGTNAFDPRAKRWDADVLDALGIGAELFPEVVASDARVGGLSADAARATGLREGLPVVAGAGDNAAAATGLGLGSATPELGSVSLGTSGVLFAATDRPEPDPEGRVHLFCHADGGWNYLAVTLAAAGSVRWARDVVFPELSFAALVELAASAPEGSRGVTFHPYLAGERTPLLDPDVRGAWQGLSLATTRADLARSVLEGVALSLRDAREVLRPLFPQGGGPKRWLATGGGARSAAWLGILASALEAPLRRPELAPGAAHGAALLAWRAQGEEVETDAGEDRGWLEPVESEALEEAWKAYRERRPARARGQASGGGA